MDSEEIVSSAEDLLNRRYGGSQRLYEARDLGGSGIASVIRARVASNPFLPHRTVIVKHAPVTGNKLEDAAFFREIVSYQFTTSLAEDVRPGPVLLAYDYEHRLLVISDSGDGDTFAELLWESDPDKRIQILRNLGTALGKMHAGTHAKEKAFDILFSRMLRNHPESEQLQTVREKLLGYGITTGLDVLESSGISVPQVVSSQVNKIRERVLKGYYRAFTPFDLSPDNIIVADRTEFLDYEWAGFREVSFDLACVIGGFPQFLSMRPVTDDEAAAFLDAWVIEVEDFWPGVVQEDVLHEEVTNALIGWALSSVTLMNYGSMSRMLLSRPNVREELGLSDDFVHTLGINAEETMERTGDLLRDASAGGFSDDELLIRRDLYETFEALARFAAGGRDTRYVTVAQFAADVAKRCNDYPAQ